MIQLQIYQFPFFGEFAELLENSNLLILPQIFINNNFPTENDPNFISQMECINLSDKPYYKLLGVIIDPNLSFKPHINHVLSKVSKSLYFLRTAKNLLNDRALNFIYYSLFHSHLIYAIQIYSSTNDYFLLPLFKKQKAALRIIYKEKYNAHTEPLFKTKKILPFPTLCEFFRIQFMHSFVNNVLPISFQDTWTTNRIQRGDQAQVELRNDDSIYIPFSRTNFSHLKPLYRFPTTWENFPRGDIKFLRNKIQFNTELKKHFLEQLSETINCNRLLCPACHLN